MLGLANFLAYGVIYAFIGGEAWSAGVTYGPDGRVIYCVLTGDGWKWKEVPQAVYIYSGIHSISIWATSAAVMMAMLLLAKERIVSSMHSTIVRGRTFITILGTIITITAVIVTILVTLQFINRMTHPQAAEAKPTILSPASSPARAPGAGALPGGSP
jgi:heme/copper-type cytochrome/quinol oxidase subunit 2